jgi:hypothetical protein
MAGLCNAVIIYSVLMKQACNNARRYAAQPPLAGNSRSENNSSNDNKSRTRTELCARLAV